MAEADVEAAIESLFKAYDIDESGELSRDEFLKIEMRLCFEAGEVFKEDARVAKLTLADKDGSGSLDYQEFRERQLRSFHEMEMTKRQIIEHVTNHVRLALTERQKMGARYHAGIRSVLKKIFSLFDVSGDASLSPEEWIAAQKIVALEVSDDIDEAWIDEKAFAAADLNGDGVLDLGEFLEASFNMFEGVKKRTDGVYSTLQRILQALEAEKLQGRRETPPITILVQSARTESTHPEFQPPHSAWQDEPTEEERDKNASAWMSKGEIAMPMNMNTAEDIAGLLRMFLQLSPDMWISVFYLGAAPDGGSRPVTLLRGERAGEGNVAEFLSYVCKPNAERTLYIKNVRKRPTKLFRQPRAWEDRDSLLAKRVGQCFGLDWETQLVGDGEKLPQGGRHQIALGEALVIEVPQTDDNGEYRYIDRVFMDNVEVLSKPVEENIVPKAKKKKKKAGPEPDPMLQLTFVGCKEGKCIVFVDMGWEDQEEKLAAKYKLTTPVAEDSFARIGPIEIEVTKGAQAPNAKDKGTLQWWNGEKWSNKKGPAKKKKKKG